MSSSLADAPSICGEKRADGKPCQSKVKPGSGPCMWHAKTWKHRLRAWATNKTLSFLITLFVAISPVIFFVYQEFVKSKPVVVAPRSTGNAMTSGPNSPALTGDGNSVTYSQPEDDKKKEPKKPKESKE